MNESNYGHHGNEGMDPGGGHHNAQDDPRPYWKYKRRSENRPVNAA